MSMMCPFFKPKHYGICLAQGSYMPSIVEKESYCCTSDYKSCNLFHVMGDSNIRVMYNNGKYDTVEGFVLDELIEEAEIRKFRRLDGWVKVGCDPIRVRKNRFVGTEKRKL